MAKIDAKLAGLLKDQVALEAYSIFLYRHISNLASEAFPGIQEWAAREAKEEARHFFRFQDYLNDRGFTQAIAADYEGCGAIGTTPAAWFEYLLRVMVDITKHLNKIASAADEAGDEDVERFVHKYLKLQTRSESYLSTTLAQLKAAGTDAAALQALDERIGRA